jgi:glucose/mannose-6-phosphate isomerase
VRRVLDDTAALHAGDPGGIVEAFGSTGAQLRESFRGARKGGIPFTGEVHTVTFCGMGGSASAGDVVAAAFADRAPAPMLTLRGYRIPGGYGRNDLVVCVSYSGNTEETVAAFEAARRRGSTTIAVCGGGALADAARASDAPVVPIPTTAPVPRAGLGSLVGGVLGALVAAGATSGVEADVDDAAAVLGDVTSEWSPAVPTESNPAKQIAEWVAERIPVIWGAEGVGAAAAWRWKTAFNENAEVPAFASALPELDHHEVVGWAAKRGEGFCLLILREDGEHERVQARLDATLEEMAGSGLEWREVHASGGTPLARALSLAVLGDMASAYHALARGLDPAAMDPLIRIKERLSS